MSDMVKLAQREILRGEILKLCREAAPVGCSEKVLKAAVEKLELSADGMEQELYYLKEKGLLKKEHMENKRLGISRDIYMITAAGMDYLDGNWPDIPGIGV